MPGRACAWCGNRSLPPASEGSGGGVVSIGPGVGLEQTRQTASGQAAKALCHALGSGIPIEERDQGISGRTFRGELRP
jgi:hypothetical protein